MKHISRLLFNVIYLQNQKSSNFCLISMSHNSKYYAKSLKTNPVKSRNIKSLFQNLQQPTTDENTKTLPSTLSKLEATTEDSLDLEVSIDLSKEYESTQLADSTSITPSPTALSINLPSKKITKATDIRLKSTEKMWNSFSWLLLFGISQNGWMCKICPSFATQQGDLAFIERPGNISDHPTERFTDHLKTKRHKDALSNRTAYLEMCNRSTDVWKLAREASLASTATKINRNRFVIKSFFWNWTFNDYKKLGVQT